MPLLERSKLYKDVWSRPCTRIAAELGISSSALKRICTEMDKGERIESHLGEMVALVPLDEGVCARSGNANSLGWAFRNIVGDSWF